MFHAYMNQKIPIQLLFLYYPDAMICEISGGPNLKSVVAAINMS
jgi:hypothetical protein